MEAAVAAQPCNFTRAELMKALADSGYGANVAAYKAWFRSTADGTNLCATCGLPPGHHRGDVPISSVDSSGGGAAFGVASLLQPTATAAEMMASGARTRNSVAPTPLHWRGAHAFAPLLQFAGVTAVLDIGTPKHPRQLGILKWRCMVADDAGARCGEVFPVQGVFMRGGVPITGTGVMFAAQRPEDNENPIVAHMRAAHGLEFRAAGRFTERFLGFCDDPRAAVTVLCPVPEPLQGLGAACPDTCPADEGRGVCCANSRALGSLDENTAILPTAPLDRAQCGCGNCPNLFLVPFIGHATLVAALTLVGAIVTMCGFPCNSDAFPPLVCWCCFKNRRRMVKALGADESNCESRCKVLFCCPCSETQIWRELRGSGVWPGLLCCTASDEDKEIMSAAAVRRRYQLGDGSAAGVTAAGSHASAMAFAQLSEAPPPKIGYAMF